MFYFVVNPSAQSGRGQIIWKELVEEIENANVAYKCYMTRHAKDATRIARRLTEGKRLRKIVVLGGDGTLNEFLNGMKRTSNIELGYIPIGSGNDFGKGMGISKNYKRELKKILSGAISRNVDYGTITFPGGKKKRFFVSCGIGFDARVCHDVNRTPVKKVLNAIKMGKLVYLVIGVRNIIGAGTFTGRIDVDGKMVLKGSEILFASIQNLPYEGGGFAFCPKAAAGNGYLDICVAKGIPKWKIPVIIPMAMIGKHIGQKGVYQFRCKEMVIRTKRPEYVHTDGEAGKKYHAIHVAVSPEKIVFIN